MNSAMDKEIRNLEEGQPAEYSGSSLAYLAALWSSGMQHAWWVVMGSLSIIVLVSLLSHGKRIAAESVQLRNILVDFINYPNQSELIWEPDTCFPMAIPVPRVEDMTLDEKIGQMTLIDQIAVTETSSGHGDDVANYFIGSVFSAGGGAPVWGNTSPDWARLVDHIQSKAAKTRLQIPILYGVDAVHGNNNVFGTTIFPHHIGLGATRDPGLVRRVAGAAARETAGTGIRWTFSPAVSVCRDPRWGRCYESFSEETSVVTAVAAAEIDGWQKQAPGANDSVPGTVFVAATAKHYMGDGGTQGGVDQGDTIISEEDLRLIHLPPYIEAIKRGVASIMVSFSSVNGVKMHANRYLITDVLKNELGFAGVVVSDCAALQKMPGTWAEQVRMAVNAGIDMVMVPLTYREFIATLKDEVTAGRVSESRIDDAVRRVLRMKVRLGLFENACAQTSLLATVGSVAHRAVAREAVRKSLVLLKDERRGSVQSRSMFPLRLDPSTSLLVAGSHADDLGLQCGGWTISWQGGSGNVTEGTSILGGVRKVATGKGARVAFKLHPDGSEVADYGIVVVGEPSYSEYEGDDDALQLDSASREAIETVCSNMPCVVVLVSGRPLEVDYLLPNVDALVAAWLPGSEGDGVGDAIFGASDFEGRLPITWFTDSRELDVSFSENNITTTPLYPIGYGLTKTGNQVSVETGRNIDIATL